jgi:enamine deaminase RidA (YjgF/YER057c/UK114 family)
VSRKNISSGSRFEELASYSRAVLIDDWVVVSGTVGTDPNTGQIPRSPYDQAINSFRHIEASLAEGGLSLNDVVKCGVFITSIEYLQDVIAVLAKKFARVRPANTTIICELPVPYAKVEIDIWARRGSMAPRLIENP